MVVETPKPKGKGLKRPTSGDDYYAILQVRAAASEWVPGSQTPLALALLVPHVPVCTHAGMQCMLVGCLCTAHHVTACNFCVALGT